MFEAQYLFSENSVYSPWMSRSADNMIATLDLIARTGSDLTIEVYQKNSEDTGDGFAHPNEDSSGTATATKIETNGTSGTIQYSQTFTEVMELVRYKITASAGASATDRALFRMLPPVWFDDVKA